MRCRTNRGGGRAGWSGTPAQMQALNPLLVMLLIPFNNVVLYPALRRCGIEVTAVAADGLWASCSRASHGSSRAVIQLAIDGGDAVSIALAGPALCVADVRRGAGVGDRPRIRLQPGSAVDEGRDHELLDLSVTFGNLWVLMTNAAVRNDAVTARDCGHRPHRERVPDVLLRGVRVRRRACCSRCMPAVIRCRITTVLRDVSNRRD